jgi:MFS family permease
MRTVGILLLPFVPESLKVGRDSERSLLAQLQRSLREISRGSWSEGLRRTNPLGLLRILYAADTPVDRPTQRNVLALACINTILFGAFMGAMNVTMLYSEFRFEWGNTESGTFLFTVNVFRTLVTVLVLPIIIALSRHMSGPRSSPDNATSSNGAGHIDSLDVFLLRISILSNAIGYIGYALSPTGALFTLSGVIASFGAMGLATVEASMTKLLPAAQTGELLGALGLLQALARIIAPTVAGLMYSWTTETFPQLVFWEFAGCFMLAGLLTWILEVVVPKHGEIESGFDVHEEEEILTLRDRKMSSFP